MSYNDNNNHFNEKVRGDKKMKYYDLVVIGTGSGASTAAYTCRKEGLSVAIIDERPYGGTCALRGCDPKKVLVGVAQIMDEINRMSGYGMESGSKLNWTDLMAFKKTFTEPVPENREKGFEEEGIDCFHGTASFVGDDEIKIGEEHLRFKNLLIASGAIPRPLSIKGEEHVLLSDDFLELEALPKDIVFIGGGFISFEFAHIASRAGSNVHILHRNQKPLKNFDAELVGALVESSRAQGIQIHLDTNPKSIERKGNRYVIYMDNDSTIKELECDLIIHGAGRIPNLKGMDLEKGHVSFNHQGVTVDAFLKSTSNPRVYAAGDVSSSPGLPLTPVAGMESRIVAHNILHDDKKRPEYDVMPSIIFSIPPLAMIGLTQEEANEEKIEIAIKLYETTDWYTYRRTREKVAMVKTITSKKTGELLGVHILGENAAELINYFALIMKFNLPIEKLKDMIFAYPTSASDLKYLL